MLWEKSDIIPNEVIDYISKDWNEEWFHSETILIQKEAEESSDGPE